MIAISTPTYDLSGVLIVENPIIGSNADDLIRRSTRTATLDGESVLNDLGFSDSDRTIQIVIYPTQDEEIILKNIVKFYSVVNLYILEDVFNANPSELRYNRNGSITITLLIISKAT